MKAFAEDERLPLGIFGTLIVVVFYFKNALSLAIFESEAERRLETFPFVSASGTLFEREQNFSFHQGIPLFTTENFANFVRLFSAFNWEFEPEAGADFRRARLVLQFFTYAFSSVGLFAVLALWCR